VALDVDAADAAGRWLRHVPHGADPVGRPEPAPDGRWQRGRIVPALYLARDQAGMWAEWYRWLAEAAIPPHAALPRDVWTFGVRRLAVADLSSAERLERAGLSEPEPSHGSWRPFQRVGEQLHREGWRGLLAPSAARPGSLVLCVFLTGGLPQEVRAIRPHLTVAEPPAPPVGMRT
jgi:RES domain-containing protein